MTQSPPWPHRWAVLTVCATLALLALGSIVTTFRVGMADPIWPTSPWYLFGISWQEPSAGFLIEHTHRLAGYIVGCCIIVLTVLLWLQETRRWLKWLGAVALVAVILQGLFGGFRVKLNALVGTDLAVIHGCFAQVVFCLLVSLALFTSRSWQSSTDPISEPSPRLRRAATWTTLLVFLQIVLGAILRHTHSGIGQRGHLLVAFAVVAAVVWLVKSAFESPRNRALIGSVQLLAVLVVGQLLLGVEAWMVQYTGGVLPEMQMVTLSAAFIRTAHVLLGSCILVASVVITLRAHRQMGWHVELASAPAGRLEGAA